MKQVIIVNKSIKMSVGKTAAQVAHASLGAFLRSDKGDSQEWRRRGQKKIVVLGEGLEELEKEASKLGIPNFLVSDAGLTELEPGTVTALGLGPLDSETIDKVSGELSLL
jgi:PTH2 family peptidyl-tRNA hydrolase